MKRNETKVIANVRVGERDVEPAVSRHVRGVAQGNRPKGIDQKSADRAEGSARRSTGIRPKDHDAIDPRMPKISPA